MPLTAAALEICYSALGVNSYMVTVNFLSSGYGKAAGEREQKILTCNKKAISYRYEDDDGLLALDVDLLGGSDVQLTKLALQV